MGGSCSIQHIEFEISKSDSSSDLEPLEPLELLALYQPKKKTEKKEIIYDKQMIRAIFLNAYLKKNPNSIKKISSLYYIL